MNRTQQHKRHPAPQQDRSTFARYFSSGLLDLLQRSWVQLRWVQLGLLPLGSVQLRFVLLGTVLLNALGCETQSTPVGESRSETPMEILTKVEDLDGAAVDPVRKHQDHVRAFIFARTDCPISRRYAPEIRRLWETFSPREVKFTLVFPNPSRSGDEIRKHLREFDYPCDAVRDPNHVLVSATGAKMTPEAAVYDTRGELVYVGRIDDRFPQFGVVRDPTTHELEDAILAALDGGQMPVADGPAVGCYIRDLRR